MIYLDACFLIYAVEGIGPRGDAARRALGGAASGQRFAISPLVAMECLVKPFRQADLRLEDDYRAAFTDFEMLTIPPTVFERAARLRASARIKTPDALHWAIAHSAGCRRLWTGDAGLAAAAKGFAIDPFVDVSP